jgi:hypothetical protein
MVSLFSLAFFLAAELVYKNNLLFVYYSKADAGGSFFPSAIRCLVFGLMFSHILLMSYLLGNEAYYQMGVIAALLFVDVYAIVQWRKTFEVPSKVVPLEIAAAKDESDKQLYRRCAFTNQVYEQPSLRLEDVVEEPFYLT